GATTDGRTIERSHIQDMAETYDPLLYGARIWVEHLRSLLPDSPFRAYGDVVAVKAEEVDIGGVSKLALFAQIVPTDDLVAMVNVSKQKLYTSIEIAPKFADTGRAYLQGLAVTDTPASLGTEMLAFAAQHPDKSPLTARKIDPANLFTSLEEVQIDFEDTAPAAPRKNLVTQIFAGLGLGKPAPAPTPAPESDPAAHLATLSQQLSEAFAQQEQRMEQLNEENRTLSARVQSLSTQVAGLRKTLDETPQAFTSRPPVAGPGVSADDVTDC
ncbi:GPO family capsid scaffolding protein, partial [Stenotrophomonas sp. B1-1]|uniref:GPO family capsid scaffolding protein n=1 Tax=Stenotrophomonas sp. B1-1 TaxID=2710648 RepID=UPI0013D925C6